MATKNVEMARRDPANAQRFVSEMVDVEVVRVNIKNCDPAINGRVFTDVVSGGVWFATGETKSLEVSEAAVAEIRARRGGAWELVP